MLLPELFKNYLQVEKASSVTVKNYLADINHFLEWLTQKTGIKHQIVGKGIFGLFTKETLNEYKTEQLIKETPLSTLNRRLSALRKFGQFGLRQGWLKENPAITNAGSNLLSKNQDQSDKVLSEFQKQLEKEKVSLSTIKNYLSDLRHFLSWLEFS
jgi:site-specific recombinase XerD